MFMACWNCWVKGEALAMPPKELRSFWLLWNIRWAASLRWSGLTYDPFLSCMPLFRKCCNMTFCPCPSNVECLGVEANMCLGIVSVGLWSLWIVRTKTISEKGKIQANLNGFYTWDSNKQNLDFFEYTNLNNNKDAFDESRGIIIALCKAIIISKICWWKMDVISIFYGPL